MINNSTTACPTKNNVFFLVSRTICFKMLHYFFFPKSVDTFVIVRKTSVLNDFGFGMLFSLNGCGMGLLFVLVSPCFRENVVVTCKTGSFLCSLDNLLQKNELFLFFENQWRSFEKRAIFDLLFTFFSYQGKVTKIPSAHISLTYIHVFCSHYWLFCLTNFEKIRTYQVWVLFGVIPGVDSYSLHFRTIN